MRIYFINNSQGIFKISQALFAVLEKIHPKMLCGQKHPMIL